MAGFFIIVSVLIVTSNVQSSVVKLPEKPNEPQGTQKSIVDLLKPSASKGTQLDLAFIMDTTGSMASYINSARQNIREIVEEIVATSQSDVRLALIEYRDHAPEDKTFVTRKNDFTNSVSTMKSWLNAAEASGGGDRPEAVANAMFEATKLSWRPDATKISVMVSDAPPHGLVPSEDNSYPDGSPDGHDPMQIARDLAQKRVTLYVIGCEPAIVPYKDFFMALAYLTGGQYVPLSVPRLLVNAITGGAKEEISLRKFEKDVQQELQRAAAAGGPINKQQIATSVFQKLKKSGAKTTQLVRNDQTLEGPSANAKSLAELTSMAEVRKKFKKGTSPSPEFSLRSGPFSRLRPSFKGSFSKMGVMGAEGSMARPVGGPADSSASSASDTLKTVESGITMDQINRLVEKGAVQISRSV